MIKCDACDFRTPYKVCPLFYLVPQSPTFEMLKENIRLLLRSFGETVCEIKHVPSTSFSVESR